MKFKFPLQRVLQHRKSLESIAQKAFLEVQAELQEAEARLKQLEEQLSGSFQKIGSAVNQNSPKGLNQASTLGIIFEFQKGQKIVIQQQLEKIQKIQVRVEEKREILRKASIEYKILERMKEKKKTDFISSFEAEEQKQTDEMNILRHRKEKDF